jgi:H+-transporting ATPase
MENNPLDTETAKRVPIGELAHRLSSDSNGLSATEAERRLKQFGANEIPEKKTNPIIKFLRYFWGPIPWMIEIAVVLSAIIGHWEDFAIILALLIVNATVGFGQEHQAGSAVEALKRRLALKARVLRDGRWGEVPAIELVPGDVVRVRLGDIVPADIKLIDGEYLLVDESALTGESLPVEKHVSDVSYSSSIIRQGEMNAFVVATGMNSYFGKTTKLVEEAKTRSHFQKAVIRIGDYLIALAAALVSIIFIVAILRHASLLDTLQYALVLTVASIPVALPAVLTVTMAVGAVDLARKEAIVSKLVSIEEIAGVDVLCADKTGTITENKLSVAEVRPMKAFTNEDVLLFGFLASREEDQDPIDNTVIAEAKTLKLTEKAQSYTLVAFKPFDPVAKRTEATLEDHEKTQFKVAKGAPQAILSLVADRDLISKDVDESVNAFAEKGYRSLGVAKTDTGSSWQYVGLISIYDPPRKDSAKTLKTAQSMGVNVKMITGDHIAIAKEVASEVHLGTNIIPASTLVSNTSERDAQKLVEEADGFAEVFPEHKYHIVELLQESGHIVGMTGDGVNDAPALKKADAGVAVAGATDAARSAAHIVLTKPGLSVIVDAISESRKIFQRMNNYAIYRIAETMRVVIFLTLAIVIFNFYPLTAIMIVIIAMLNDLPIMMIAYDNAKIRDKPVRWRMRHVLTLAIVLGLLGVVSSFLLFFISIEILRLNTLTIETLMFLKMTVAGHMTIYLARTDEKHFWSRPLPSIRLFGTSELTQLGGTFVAVYGVFMSPLGWVLGVFIWAYALAFFFINDFVKISIYKLVHRGGTP